MHDGLRERARIGDKGGDIADVEPCFCDEDAADHTDEDVPDVTDEIHHWKHHAGEKLRFPAGAVKVAVDGLEGLDGILLLAECFDDPVAREHLLCVAADVAEVFLLGSIELLRIFGDEQRNCDIKRHGRQHDQREERADGQHHDDVADHLQQRGD